MHKKKDERAARKPDLDLEGLVPMALLPAFYGRKWGKEGSPPDLSVSGGYISLTREQSESIHRMYTRHDGLFQAIEEARSRRESGDAHGAQLIFDSIIHFARKTEPRGDFRNTLLKYEISGEDKYRRSFQWLAAQPEWRSLKRFMEGGGDDKAAALRRDKAEQFAGNPMDMYEEVLVLTGKCPAHEKEVSFEFLANFAREMPEKFAEQMVACMNSEDAGIRATSRSFVDSPQFEFFRQFLKRKLGEKDPFAHDAQG